MPEVYNHNHTTKSFAAALNLSQRTVKRLVADGKVRSVLLTKKARRLEDPADFQARQVEGLAQ
jgi:DNA-binding transcriptional regulator LsrR (DeoR family)